MQEAPYRTARLNSKRSSDPMRDLRCKGRDHRSLLSFDLLPGPVFLLCTTKMRYACTTWTGVVAIQAHDSGLE
jgi:hypothetical protein